MLNFLLKSIPETATTVEDPFCLCGENYHIFYDGNERCGCGEKRRSEMGIPQVKASKKKLINTKNA